jgi:hypothetical protein
MSSPSADPISSISGKAAAKDYGSVDPYGNAAALKSLLYGAGGTLAGGPMGVFDQNAQNVIGQLAGLSGPLADTLTGLAGQESAGALNAAGSNFANLGALGSGAAAQAFGQAIANPFAQAQASLQGQQLSAGSGALGQLLGVSSNAFGQGLGAGTNLMENTSGLVAPQYMTNPKFASQAGKQQGWQGALTGGLGMAGGIAGGKGLSKLLGLP